MALGWREGAREFNKKYIWHEVEPPNVNWNLEQRQTYLSLVRTLFFIKLG